MVRNWAFLIVPAIVVAATVAGVVLGVFTRLSGYGAAHRSITFLGPLVGGGAGRYAGRRGRSGNGGIADSQRDVCAAPECLHSAGDVD
jgi:hypothetical protein